MERNNHIGAFIRSVLAGFFIALSAALYGQIFEPVETPFIAAGRGAVAWCDYDQDHDLDLLICGLSHNETRVSILYRNDEGTFVDAQVPLIPVTESAAAWGDFDLDGDLDLLLAGNSENGDITRIYRNDGEEFLMIDAGFPGIQNGEVCWVDFDRDGDLDVFITGNWLAKLYVNQDGTFADSGQSFGLFSSASASFGDFDNDGDPDLLITGDSGAGAVSKVFLNESGIFSEFAAGLPGLMAGTSQWVDYDNDGDLDIAISGFNDALEAQFFLYKNEDQKFTLIYAGIDGFALGSADWGDYDHDGDLDLLMSGKATGCGAIVSAIYRNDGNDVFYKTSVEFTTAIRCSLAWADYDNDGDLDFVVSGLNYADVPFSRLYRNLDGSNLFASNTIPSHPVNLVSELAENQVVLSWAAGWDAETPVAALTYNLCVGTAPGRGNIISPMADTDDGNRMVLSLGNVGQNLQHRVTDLLPGTYFWSVQAIDQAFDGSPFIDWQSFTVTVTGDAEPNLSSGKAGIYPNPASDRFMVTFPEGIRDAEISITDLSGRMLKSYLSAREEDLFDISGLPEGHYLVRVAQGDHAQVLRLIKTGR